MSHILTSRERKALDRLSLDRTEFVIKGELPAGIGEQSLNTLVSLGLAELGPGRFGETGWRMTPDGWRCMYGKTYEEIMAPGAGKSYPLRGWRWPPE